MHPTQQPRAAQRGAGRVRHAALAWLLLALVLVSTVGQLHRVLHFAPHAGPADLVAAQHAHAPDARGAGAALGAEAATAISPGAAVAEEDFSQALRRLLPQHTTADCQLLDQLALGQALHAAALVLPAALPPGAPALPCRVAPVARHAAAFHARGPPAR
ncbi:hypothetical protein [Extensimonas perlucida]|uniref:hypothetical protein n=1 Tax=Extensimonas perlucida TaxID=2590786 RepID=UPI0019BE1C24|nr:hypothetical protein [Burkholderiaceae bacterium]